MYRRVRSREVLELLSEESLRQKGCGYEALELAKIKEHEQVLLQYEVDITKQMLCLPSQLMFK